ncbi:hypothetical protein YB2330_004790 [Saitoella coloradoensis]
MSDDTRVYLYTSLAGGSTQLTTATTRIASILDSHKIVYTPVDLATGDEIHKRIWQRKTSGKRLPGVVVWTKTIEGIQGEGKGDVEGMDVHVCLTTEELEDANEGGPAEVKSVLGLST